jgi:hypothetical protein
VELDTEIILYRIINGYYYINIDNIKYKILLPNLSDKQQAQSIYLSLLDDYKFDTDCWISDKFIKYLLKTYNIWNEDNEKSYKELLKALDNAKIQYFLNFNNASNKETLKKSIINLNKNIEDANIQKHCFDHLTLEYYAQSLKNQYLICSTVYKEDGSKVFNEYDNINTSLLDKILSEIYLNSLTTNDIKKIAKHELWKAYWGSSKENIFSGCVKDWTDEQRSLVNFTKTLDSIREHMEAPSEQIIEDNDALDGWILYQHEKIEKEKKQKHIAEKYGLNDKHGNEIFLMSSNTEDTKEILSLNDRESMKNIQEIISISNSSQDSVDWVKLPHVKRELLKQQNEMMKNQKG